MGRLRAFRPDSDPGIADAKRAASPRVALGLVFKRPLRGIYHCMYDPARR